MTIPQIEVAVIGSGVMGLAIARALARTGRQVVLLERAASIGTETSSRNSQVVHAGLYYQHKSFKHVLCTEGRRMLYEFCRERSIDVNKCGKLIVANQHEKLVPLYHRAIQNGVSNVQWLTTEQTLALEPALIAGAAALWSPSTGIVDVHSFLYSLLEDAEAHGATLVLKSPVEDVRIRNGKIELYVGDVWISSAWVVNAAGLWADQVAGWLHPRGHSWQPPKQYYCKGNYFQLQGQTAPFSRLVYPLPDERGGLGVHATIDLEGNVKFGPDVEWLPANIKPNNIDYTVHADRAEHFYNSIRNYWPDLQDGALVPDYAGVRPKLSHPSQNRIEHDFVIAGPSEHGVKGFIHLLGMESPGLTSAMAIAKYIVSKHFGGS